jgi:histone acetyltransferase
MLVIRKIVILHSLTAELCSAEGEEEEEEDDEEEEDTMQTFSAARLDAPAHGVPRVKAELATEGGVRETGVAAQSAILGSNPAGAAVGPVEVKPSVADTIQTSGAYCSREENLKKEEDAGRLRFVCHSNDGIDQHMIWCPSFHLVCAFL